MKLDLLKLFGLIFFGFWLVYCVLLGACSKSIDWQEEVLLSSGQKIIIDRTVKLIPSELGRKRATNYEIRTKFPRMDKNLVWEGGFGVGPIMLNFKDGAAFIVAIPIMCDARIKKYSEEGFPYIFMRSGNGENWETISPNQFPTEYKNANLSYAYDSYRMGEGNLFRKGNFQTSEMISKANEYTELHSSEGYFQVSIPRSKEEWNYKLKDKYHEGCN